MSEIDINKRAKVIQTEDGSSTLYLEDIDETYHSTNGAHQESLHIFINHGLKAVDKKEVRILEIGFGTGLNAIMTLIHKDDLKVDYHTLEPLPLSLELINSMSFDSVLNNENQSHFLKLHEFSWNKSHEIQNMTFCKYDTTLEDFLSNLLFDVIYFDAFAPSKQPEVWEIENLSKCYDQLKVGGVLVTYCASGKFKRNLKSIGFELEHPPGPKGKREITKAIKL